MNPKSKGYVSNVKNLFSNKVIIIDEVHNLHPHDKSKDKTYNLLHTFLHTIQNSKIILLSGTPMRDSGTEIKDILNLILPLNNQISPDHFNDNGELINEKSFVNNFIKGRVSYLQDLSVNDSIKKEFVGDIEIGNFKIYQNNMVDGGIQNSTYNKLYNDDNLWGEFSRNLRQASLMVFPDNSFGNTSTKGGVDSGFQKYIETSNSKSSIISKGGGFTSYELKRTEWCKVFTSSFDENLEILKKLSTKYGNLIQMLEQEENRTKSTFIYEEALEQSGLGVLAALLRKFGFTRITTKSRRADYKGFAIISGNESDNVIQAILDIFNSPENFDGKLIRIILGSAKIKEGLNLKNVQIVHVMSPHWNFADKDQAIGRAFRVGSHKVLLENLSETERENFAVKIYLHAAIPVENGKPNTNNSIDLKLYKLSAAKDRPIKRIEYLIKTNAFDCELNFNKNIRNSQFDNKRECEYEKCEYSCEGITDRNPKKLDYSTYNLYYDDEAVYNIKKIIEQLINEGLFSFSINDLKKNKLLKWTKGDDFLIIKALGELVNSKEIIYNKFGMQSVLCNEGDIFYIRDSISDLNPSILNVFYSEFPCIHPNFNQICYLLNELKDGQSMSEINPKLPLEIQESLIKRCLLMDAQKQTSPVVKKIIEFWEKAISQDGKILSLQISKKKICLNLDNKMEGWKDCLDSKELSRTIKGYTCKEIDGGSISITVPNLTGKTELSKKPRGKKCESFHIPELENIIEEIGITGYKKSTGKQPSKSFLCELIKNHFFK